MFKIYYAITEEIELHTKCRPTYCVEQIAEIGQVYKCQHLPVG